MYFVLFLLFFTYLNGMNNVYDTKEISFSEDKDSTVSSAVFIDENRIAFTNPKNCFIYKINEGKYISISEKKECSSLCVNQTKDLFGFINGNSVRVYDSNTTSHVVMLHFDTYAGNINFCSDGNIILYKDGYITYFNLETTEQTGTLLINPYTITIPSKKISCHPKENSFLVCYNYILHSIVIQKNSSSIIPTINVLSNMHQYTEAQYNPSGTSMALKTLQNNIVMTSVDEISDKNNILTFIGNPSMKYKAYCFCPSNKDIIALLNSKNVLQYWNHVHNTLLYEQQIPRYDSADIAHSDAIVCFSPKGRQLLAVIDKKIVLFNVPCSIVASSHTIFIYWILKKFMMKAFIPLDILKVIEDYF